ncbi:MAG: SPOR domain-containing protein [Ferruginibacter sp.]
MNKLFFLILCFAGQHSFAQKDTAYPGITTVIKDYRIDVLGRKMAEYNESLAAGIRNAKGYRLMLLSTSDRKVAMKLRSQLLQLYPDQKVYMAFQSPYIKLKFGNFVERTDADKFRKLISAQNLVNSNIYIVPEIVEVKPEKNLDQDPL